MQSRDLDSSVFPHEWRRPETLYVVRDGGAGKAAVVYFVPVSRKPRPLRAPIRPL
jgi:hypothetical protein